MITISLDNVVRKMISISLDNVIREFITKGKVREKGLDFVPLLVFKREPIFDIFPFDDVGGGNLLHLIQMYVTDKDVS